MLFEAAERTTTQTADTPAIVPEPAESVAMDKHLAAVALKLAGFEQKRQRIKADVNYSDTYKANEIAKIDAEETSTKPALVEKTLKALDDNLTSLVSRVTKARATAAADELDTAKIQMYQSSLEHGHLSIHGSVAKAVKAYNGAAPEFKRALQMSPDHVNRAFPQAAYQNDVLKFRQKLAADYEAATEPEPVKLANAQLDMFMMRFGTRRSRTASTLRWLDNRFGSMFGDTIGQRFDAIVTKAAVDDSNSYTETLFG